MWDRGIVFHVMQMRELPPDQWRSKPGLQSRTAQLWNLSSFLYFSVFLSYFLNVCAEGHRGTRKGLRGEECFPEVGAAQPHPERLPARKEGWHPEQGQPGLEEGPALASGAHSENPVSDTYQLNILQLSLLPSPCLWNTCMMPPGYIARHVCFCSVKAQTRRVVWYTQKELGRGPYGR